jgi:hypothetical protein
MNKSIVAAVLIFAAVLAVVLGMQLSGQAAAIAFGAAIGVIVGVPVGIATSYMMLRSFPVPPSLIDPRIHEEVHIRWDDIPAEIMILTPDQAQALIALLQQPISSAALPASMPYSEGTPNPSPPTQSNSAARQRDISIVGGADLSESFDE